MYFRGTALSTFGAGTLGKSRGVGEVGARKLFCIPVKKVKKRSRFGLYEYDTIGFIYSTCEVFCVTPVGGVD